MVRPGVGNDQDFLLRYTSDEQLAPSLAIRSERTADHLVYIFGFMTLIDSIQACRSL